MIITQSLANSLNAANANAVVNIPQATDIVVAIAGTFSGTLSFFGSMDAGVTYRALAMVPSTSIAPYTTGLAVSTTTTGLWLRNDICGLTHFKVEMTSFVSGPAVVDISIGRRGK